MCMVVVLSRLLMPSWTVWVVDWGNWRLNCDMHGERLTYYLRSMSKCGKNWRDWKFCFTSSRMSSRNSWPSSKTVVKILKEYLSTVSDPAVRERLLLKHGGSSDLSESDILGAFGTSEDSKYQGFQYASKYIDPSTASEASEWEGASQGSPGYFHPDLLHYPRREIFTSSDYKRYRGASPCISERDIEELDRLSANLHKASTTTSTASARDVYKTLSSIRNSPLRKRDLGVLSADSTSTFDPDSYKLSSYDEFAKVSDLITDTLDLSDDSLRFASDVAASAKVKEDLRDASYSNIGSWSESSASPKRSLGMGYYSQTQVVVAPAPPDRGISEPSDYTDSNYLGHTVEERQKGHALTPVTEISPEYATSDTAGNGEGRSPESLQKPEVVLDVTTSPLSPADPTKTVTAEVHSIDKHLTLAESPCPESPLKISKKEQSQFHSNSSTKKSKSRRGKELPQIPYQPCRLKKSELLTRTEPIHHKGSNSTFPPPREQRQSKSSSPAPGRRKLPQPYIDKSGKITYDKSQGVKPATSIPYGQTPPQQIHFDSSSPLTDEPKNVSVQYETDQTHGAQNSSTQSYTTDPPQYDNITELSPEQNDTSKYVSENQQGYSYDKVQNEPYYTHDASADQTYQELPSESTDKQYSDTYYNEVDNPPYVAETYIEHNVDYQNSSYVDQSSENVDENYDWNSQQNQNWIDSGQQSSQYSYENEGTTIDQSQNQDYYEPQQEEYGSATYASAQPQYADVYQDQPYGEYGDQPEYSTTQTYSQENYEYVSEGQQDAYGYPSESGHESYPNYSEPHSVEEPKSEIYYGDDSMNYNEELSALQQPAEQSVIPPEKPLREHERAAKSERFTASPQHKGYSPQRSSKRRRQRQYSDPVTSSNAIPILSQTQVTASGTITQATKELSSSATTVAEDTSTTAGGGILSVLSSKVSKGYKMMSMPTLTKKDAAPPSSATSTKSGSKSGSMTSIFNLGSTLDSFKIGSRTKSRSDSVKSDSELSVYDEPQADLVVDYPQEEVAPPPPIRDTYSLQQASVEEDHDVFYTEEVQEDHCMPEEEYHEQEYNDETYYQEQDYQDNTGEYPEDYYETQEVEEVEEDELPSSERTVTFAEESKLEEQKRRKKSIVTDEFASLFQTVSKVRNPPRHAEDSTESGTVSKVRNPPRHPEDSVESGILTESMSNESAFFSCVSDSRQSSIAQSEYSSLGSMESVVPNDGAKQDGGSLESYGDRGQQDGSEEVQQPKEEEEEVEVVEENEATAKKGKKVQFESRSPSGGEEADAEDDTDLEQIKSKKAIGSTKSKWMKLAVRTSHFLLSHFTLKCLITLIFKIFISFTCSVQNS
ncbi:uncharacterized protein CDAR_9891 [Caerostris darwini]|uniref:Uncharacterized protein n=1 Tax=Caerostris darwini TaxID=1538125 RepID=A0AAV4QYU9_9ARAC|nr:uncharacterized protein CDAR_9891 [Caerostris darwini]